MSIIQRLHLILLCTIYGMQERNYKLGILMYQATSDTYHA